MGRALDAQLIGAVQRVEHHEIAAYGTVRTFAKDLGETAGPLKKRMIRYLPAHAPPFER
jgi:ferritin-like metal-binding protein YciE